MELDLLVELPVLALLIFNGHLLQLEEVVLLSVNSKKASLVIRKHL